MYKNSETIINRILAGRGRLPRGNISAKKAAEEGGCGVTGFISSIPVGGRHIFEPSVQMHNRGNGKGGGIAAVGLSAGSLGVSQDLLDTHYILQIALLDPGARRDVEKKFIEPYLEVAASGKIPSADDYRDIPGLEVRPPDVWRYFARVKGDVLDRFIEDNGLRDIGLQKAEDEYIYRNTYLLNQAFYASLGEKKAFVLSHGRNLMILKIVGYAEQVSQYYLLDDFKAHGWIAHQRYPTKGRVWHPGGAHPFIGMDEALVHNGDFANYHAVTEYLKQNNVFPQFLTDTEVSVLLLDLLNRTYGYPMEYIIEAMAPTTEHDFDLLPLSKQQIYRHIQSNHINSSPDGPWFFIIARNDFYNKAFQLIGITDTAMLRPQVFALQEGEVQIGLICSEKQAIDATLESLSREDDRFCPVADKYWNARGGSAADGGAFIFTVKDDGKGTGKKELICTNKFGEPVSLPKKNVNYEFIPETGGSAIIDRAFKSVRAGFVRKDTRAGASLLIKDMPGWNYETFVCAFAEIEKLAKQGEKKMSKAIGMLTFLNDLKYPTGSVKRAAVLNMIKNSLNRIFVSAPGISSGGKGKYSHVDWKTRNALRKPEKPGNILIINTGEFPPEGDDCDARLICAAHKLGWKRFICYGYRGQRFTGCGLGEAADGVRIDVYGSSGDYLASGIDGPEIYVHGNAQDQLGQIMKRGKLVVYGDVGQTFMYGAKGGDVFVMGNAAGRPLINAVGHPRVVINGTCLDYLAESFMAGDPLNGGGFVVLNGMQMDDEGKVSAQTIPYPGSNLFSLASGGAIYLRDPHNKVVEEQLNGGEFADLTQADWELIQPYLEKNEDLFGISVEKDLLTVDGLRKGYKEIYRKVQAVKLKVLAVESIASEEYGVDWEKE
jgi:glutamate synthase domain-containing protein 1/glutamate synthase domain-containing protein 3